MNDNLDVSVKLTPYTYNPTIDLDFDHPVLVRSVWNEDKLVELEHDGHKFIVAGSELEKAIKCCTNNRW